MKIDEEIRLILKFICPKCSKKSICQLSDGSAYCNSKECDYSFYD